MSLGATIITFSPGTTIKSADVNSNFANLNGVSSPSFTAVSVSGSVTAGSVYDGGNRVCVQGTHSTVQPIISVGTGVPAALATNEVFIQLS
jgi:hypothetical protein